MGDPPKGYRDMTNEFCAALRNRNMADIRPDLWRKLSTGEKVAFGSPRESPVSGEITLTRQLSK